MGRAPDFVVRWREARDANAWAQFVASGKDGIVWPVGAGAKLRLTKDLFLAEGIVKGQFEIGERRFLTKVLRKGDCFVDVGANIGLFTVLAGKLVGPSGKVIALEPAPATRQVLEKQVLLNRLRNVEIVPLGLSDRRCVEQLWCSQDGNDAFNSFGKPLQGELYQPVDVPTTTLDDLCQELLGGFAPRLIKIDVEGWEPKVLAGGGEILRSSRAPDLLVEFCEAALRNASSSCEQLFGALESLGYRMFEVNGYHGLLTPLDQIKPIAYCNVLATKGQPPFSLMMRSLPPP